MNEEIKEVYQGGYFTVYADGTMCINDGLGYLDTLERIKCKT